MTWEKIWTEHGEYMKKPDKCIIESLSLFNTGDRVLDLGCGTGRHTLPLLKHGLNVTAMDSSEECLRLLDEKFKESNYIVNIVKNNSWKVPAPNDFFDGIVCSNSIHHNTLQNIKNIIGEVHRVLKKNGTLVLISLSSEDEHIKKGTEIEPNTYVDIPELTDGACTHYLFSEAELRYLLKEFEITYFEPLLEKIDGYNKIYKRWKVIAKKK